MGGKTLAPVYVDGLTITVVTEDPARLPQVGDEIKMGFPWTGGIQEWFTVAAVTYERSAVSRSVEDEDADPSGYIYRGTMTLEPQSDEEQVERVTRG